MERMLYLSLHDGIAVSSPEGSVLCRAHLDGAGAICAGGEHIFCADHSGAIWRFDRETLMPQALSCGGPGISSMCLSACGERLYVLLGEADSVLMSDAKSGRPLVVNRCGSNPKRISVGENMLVAAGGEHCCVLMFDPWSLACMRIIAMPGPVVDAAMDAGIVYALCLAQDMTSMLIAVNGGESCIRRLPGMPGCLRVSGRRIYAATHGCLHVFSVGSLRFLGKRTAPGLGECLLVDRHRLILHDPLSENVFVCERGPWKILCGGVGSLCPA